MVVIKRSSGSSISVVVATTPTLLAPNHVAICPEPLLRSNFCLTSYSDVVISAYARSRFQCLRIDVWHSRSRRDTTQYPMGEPVRPSRFIRGIDDRDRIATSIKDPGQYTEISYSGKIQINVHNTQRRGRPRTTTLTEHAARVDMSTVPATTTPSLNSSASHARLVPAQLNTSLVTSSTLVSPQPYRCLRKGTVALPRQGPLTAQIRHRPPRRACQR